MNVIDWFRRNRLEVQAAGIIAALFAVGIIVVDGTIIAINGKDGDVIMVELKPDAYKELGRFKPLGGQSWTAPIIADGKLIIRNKAEMACFDLK